MLLVASKCRNTVILTVLTNTSSRKVFHDYIALQWSKKVDYGSIIGQKNGRIIDHEN